MPAGPLRSRGPTYLSEQSLLQVSPLPHCKQLSVVTEGFFCARLWRRRRRRRRGLSESTSLTHRVSDEILQGASLDKLGNQIQPLVLVENADEPQNMGMVEASHYFDLKIRRRRS